MSHKEALEVLRTDFYQVADVLANLAQRVVKEGITKYPVFVATEQALDLGLPAVSRDDFGLNYHFRISLLEELVRKRLFDTEKLEDFKTALGDPRQRACVLLVHTGGAEFVFLPYEPGALADVDTSEV